MTDPVLIIFDMDGTLIDSQEAIVASMEAGFQAAGLRKPDRDEVLAIVGLTLEICIDRIEPGLDEATIAKAAQGYREAAIARRNQNGVARSEPLYPGAEALLQTLHGQDHVILGAATGKARRGLNKVIDIYGWQGRFMTTQTSDEHPSKPHPSMLEACMSETGIPASRAVMIGDTSFDMEMGRSAGFHTIGVNWGYHGRDRILGAGAHQIADDMAALGQMLHNWQEAQC